MFHRSSRPPQSCQLCRSKKLRCDRVFPCSNCKQRGVSCVFHGHVSRLAASNATQQPVQMDVDQVQPVVAAVSPPEKPTCAKVAQLKSIFAASPLDDVILRLGKLEDVVFQRDSRSSRSQVHGSDGLERLNSDTSSMPNHMNSNTPVGVQFVQDSPTRHEDQLFKSSWDYDQVITHASRRLPTRSQAFLLLEHFERCLHPTLGVLHIPSTHALTEQIYQRIEHGFEGLGSSELLLLYSIFAGATLVWTPQLLETMGISQAAVQKDFATYSRMAMVLLDATKPPPTCTTSLAGTVILTHLFTNIDGYQDRVNLLRVRALLMARTMQIHRLDIARNREERRLSGYDAIELEVKRRIWWWMVATDWLAAFSGGPQEGTYLLQPKHMRVNYPANIDDNLIGRNSREPYDLPLSVPTSMSYFVSRIRLAEICRETVDVLPSIVLNPQEQPDYELVLMLSAKFQDFIATLPPFFQLGQSSVQQYHELYDERPSFAFQRIGLHFSVNTRLCRLHRPFLLEGAKNPKYAFSRMMCIRSAQTILELRRSMDEAGTFIGLRPSIFWTIMQHIFLAAITLATDVSMDPDAPQAASHKAEVLAACKMLEKWQKDSSVIGIGESIQGSVQTLISLLQKQRTERGASASHATYVSTSEMLSIDRPPLSEVPDTSTEGLQVLNNGTAPGSSYGSSSAGADHFAIGNTGELGDGSEPWSEFFSNLSWKDVPEWNSVLDGMDFSIGPTF